MDPFEPIFPNPHLLTIAGNFWPRNLDERRFPVRATRFQTEPGVQVLVHTQSPSACPVGHLILIHGLEGSSSAGYACSLAQAALETGYTVHRFNMRSCGGTEAVCGNTLYHSGQTSDLRAVVHEIRESNPACALFLVGFSLGGNVVLKLAGELGGSARELIAGIAAISTPIDLAACVRLLDKPSNRLYARRFLDRLKKRVILKERVTPGLFDLRDIRRVKTVYEFDDKFTARSFGFGTADNYYATQSSNQYLERIRIPALLVQAKDDPMIPFEVYHHPAIAANPFLQLLAVDHGGHLGFISKRKPRFWLDGMLLEWFAGTRNKLAADLVF